MFDASTAILLAKATLLGASLGLVHGALTPAVLGEVRAGKGEDVQIIEAMLRDGRLQVVEGIAAASRLAADFALGRGEAEALAAAAARAWILGTDDRKAMVTARTLGVPYLTSLHFLEALSRTEALGSEEALAKLERLARLGRYSQRLLEAARQRLEGR